MSVLAIEEPDPPIPSPASVAGALTRYRDAQRVARRLAPAADVVAIRAASPRPPSVLAEEPTGHLPDAVARARAQFIACAAGRHVFVSTPHGKVCRHCPIPADQAARVRAARVRATS